MEVYKIYYVKETCLSNEKHEYQPPLESGIMEYALHGYLND